MSHKLPAVAVGRHTKPCYGGYFHDLNETLSDPNRSDRLDVSGLSINVYETCKSHPAVRISHCKPISTSPHTCYLLQQPCTCKLIRTGVKQGAFDALA